MAMREKIKDLHPDRKLFVFITLIGVFTILGPFGTYEKFDVWTRLVFWAVIMTGIGALMHFGIVFALNGAALRLLPWPVRVMIGSAVAAVPSVGIVIFVTGFMFDTGVQAGSFPYIWLQVAVIGVIAGLIETRPIADQTDEPVGATQTRFHKRLPEGELHDIVSLSMSDHYFEVTTVAGSHLVLARFADALEELSGLPGVRLHRSHWAAKHHLRDLSKSGRQWRATLSDGRELPVSASYKDDVQRALTAQGAGNALM